MRATILAMGSRGDVEPCVVLGEELCRRGHAVVLATEPEFEGLVTDPRMAFVALAGDTRSVLRTPEGRRLLGSRNPVALLRRMGRLIGPALEEALPGARAACRGADVILYSSPAMV